MSLSDGCGDCISEKCSFLRCYDRYYAAEVMTVRRVGLFYGAQFSDGAGDEALPQPGAVTVSQMVIGGRAGETGGLHLPGYDRLCRGRGLYLHMMINASPDLHSWSVCLRLHSPYSRKPLNHNCSKL